MTKFLTAILVSCLLSGCSTFYAKNKLYEIRMISGDSLYAKSRPSLSADGYYRFNDVNDQLYIINENLVLFIEPAQFER